MAQFVTLESRQGKKRAAPSREELLNRWEAAATAELKETLAGVPARVEGNRWLRRRPVAEAFDPAQVIAEAVEKVQAEKSSWNRSDLFVEIDRALPDCLGGLKADQVRALVDELVETAVRPGPGQPVEVISLAPPPVIELPAELLREDGSSIYDAPGIETFATVAHLKREGRIVEAAQSEGAPTVDAEAVEAAIAEAGLKPAQAAAVRGIATSARKMDVLIGPAGTGKSKTVATLCGVWEASGGTVLGVATSQRAADVLAEEGVDNVANLTRLLLTNKRLARGEFVPAADREAYAVRAGQLVIIDEAGMADTIHIDEVRKLVERAGGKLLVAGDHGQVTAVGAGGMLHQLATEPEAKPYVLDEVLRFSAEWEKDASLRVRDGDASVLAVYERHGRLRGGDGEEMRERAYQNWLADHLAGKDSLLLASTNKVAGELAMQARAELVRLKRVEPEGVALGCNEDVQQYAGVGDIVALRKNNRRIKASGSKHWATNRDVVKVVGRDRDGSLTVRYGDGSTMRLPAKYVARHVELAYAGTVHSAQGRTVETCHSLVAAGISLEQLYVMLTRGKVENKAYVECEPTGARDAAGRLVIPDLWAVLEDAFERREVEYTATTTLRREFERAQNLAVVGRVWEDAHIEHAHQRYAQALSGAMSEADWERLRGTPSYESLIRLARHVEERGHDAAAMLAQVTAARSLIGAEDVGKVLHDRLKTTLNRVEQAQRREAEQAGEPVRRHGWRSYVERTPVVDSPRGRVMMAAAEAMDARRAELGRRAAEEMPAWAEPLGPVPQDPIEREAWIERAGIVAGYREAHGYEAANDAIGAAPPQGAVEAHAAWEDAWYALGAPDERRDVAMLGDQQLREVVARYEREQAWAPPFVDNELKTAHLARDDYRVRAELARAAAEAETDPQRRAELVQEATDAGEFARLHAERAAKLEQVVKGYDAWHEHTRTAREQAALAATELERRRPVEPEPTPEPEAGRGVEGQEQAVVQPSAEDVLYARYAMVRNDGHPELSAGAIARALGNDDLHRALDLQEQMRARYEREQAAQPEQDVATAEPTAEPEREAGREVDEDQEQTADRRPEAATEPEQAREVETPARDVDAEIDQALKTAHAALKTIAERQAEAERQAALEEAQRSADYDQRRRVEQERAIEQDGPQLQR
jgi:hypothetical protein